MPPFYSAPRRGPDGRGGPSDGPTGARRYGEAAVVVEVDRGMRQLKGVAASLLRGLIAMASIAVILLVLELLAGLALVEFHY